MTNRENVLRALRRHGPQKVPFEFTLCPKYIEEFRKKTGSSDYLEYYGFPIRYVEPNPTNKKTDFRKYYKEIPKKTEPLSWNPEWGVMGAYGSVAHFQHMLHPMAQFTTIKEIENYPFPDFTQDYRWHGVTARVQKMISRDLIAVAAMQMTIFEISWYLRGMDMFMMDLIQDLPFAEALLEKITEIRVVMAQNFARAGVDILMLGDDVSTQQDMMMSPDFWRSIFKPRLAKVIEAAKSVKPDILIFYHGDGNLQKIIPDLIDIGIEILNPVQPECMDPVEIKKLYGNNLSLWGTLGTQSTMPFGTREQVKQTCKQLIEQVGKGGGLLLAPTHVIEPDVPWENVQAFIEAVEEFGYYK